MGGRNYKLVVRSAEKIIIPFKALFTWFTGFIHMFVTQSF
jgi:hypothetical protein